MLNQSNYIPKDATQQNLFLSKYPEYDGRGIKIGIIDGGIDVSLDGLQKTSDGLPKIIDCFDFTGVGTVDTSMVAKMDSENCLIGVSGRKLKIPSKWLNPSKEWHLGIISLFKPLYHTPRYGKLHPGQKFEKLPENDCIVWFDGTKWLACIETLDDLENTKILTNFRDEHEYGIFKNELNLGYCVTINNEGNLLEIFTPYDCHESVVAEVAAAYNPKEGPEGYGLAPGAQIININASDRSEENLLTISAFKKALLKCIEMKVDIVIHTQNGLDEYKENIEVNNLIYEMIKKHNILFFHCAGNNGPFYQTVDNCDLNLNEMIFTIGALLTSEIREKIYDEPGTDDSGNMLSPVVFKFSSRGPLLDGSLGIDFVAPGAVIADLPRFYNVKNRVEAGTSFSTPNAAGAVACLLSALKKNSIQYSPSSIKQALSKTAYIPKNGNKLDYGYGIIQINAAFDYFCKNKIEHLWSEKERINSIFMEQKDEKENIKTFVLKLPNDVADGTNKWILQLSDEGKKCIELSEINDSSNSFSAKINTTKLEAGYLYFNEIQVLHSSIPSFNYVFNIPVTVILPLKVSETNNFYFEKEIILSYENPSRIFINPSFENYQKYCEITIASLDKTQTELYIDFSVGNDEETNFYPKCIFFTPQNLTEAEVIPIRSKVIHQICIYQRSHSTKSSKFNLKFDFNTTKLPYRRLYF